MTLKLIDTFSGIGGFSYAAEKLVGGFKTVAFVECEPYCQKVLKKHWPNVPIYDDIRTYNPEPYSADVICGGFPCQDISVAGRGEGITKETRSGLFFELMRVIRLVRPKYIVLENVAAILNNGLGIVLGELAKAGFNCEWACIPASALGACHIRDRWWLIAYPNKARLQEKRPEQQTTGIEQYGELGNVADPTSAGTWKNEYRLWRQSQGGCLQADRDSNQQISKSTSNSDSLQRLDLLRQQPKQGQETQQGISNSCNRSTSNSSSDGLQRKIEARFPRQTWSQKNSRRLNQNWRSYESEPVLRRGDDGLSNRLHRLKALGNSIVPQVAAIPLQRVLDIDRHV